MYELVLDEPIEGDIVLLGNEIKIYINRESVNYLSKKLTIDFHKRYGFILKGEHEIFAFGIKLRQI